MAKCACRDKDCTTEVRFDSHSKAMIVSREDKGEILVYLDANLCVELIRGLRACLEFIVQERSS